MPLPLDPLLPPELALPELAPLELAVPELAPPELAFPELVLLLLALPLLELPVLDPLLLPFPELVLPVLEVDPVLLEAEDALEPDPPVLLADVPPLADDALELELAEGRLSNSAELFMLSEIARLSTITASATPPARRASRSAYSAAEAPRSLSRIGLSRISAPVCRHRASAICLTRA